MVSLFNILINNSRKIDNNILYQQNYKLQSGIREMDG